MRDCHKVYGLVTVRTSSTRLPKKCLLPFGEGSILTHVIDRALKYNICPIVCTTTEKSDDIIYEIANKMNVECFRGSLNNKLKRWADCSVKYNLNDFHTIDADDPFFDGNEMILSMKKLRGGNYDVVSPTSSSSNGGASVGYSLTLKIVLEAIQNIPDSTDTEMIWGFLEKLKNIKIHHLKETNDRPTNLRLTLDFEEDYFLLKIVKQILGDSLSRKNVDNLFHQNPDLYKINWFRNQEWKSNQISKEKL